jgi:hypothetical protein
MAALSEKLWGLDWSRLPVVQRDQANTLPANMAYAPPTDEAALQRQGTVLTERCGAHAHFTKSVNTDSDRVFCCNFARV